MSSKEVSGQLAQVSVCIFTFLYFGIRLNHFDPGDPLIVGRITSIMIISPLPHRGHLQISFPVVIRINFLVSTFIFWVGWVASSDFRALWRSIFLTLEDNKPICLILTKPFGRICSANRFINLVPWTVFILDWFIFLSKYLNVTFWLVDTSCNRISILSIPFYLTRCSDPSYLYPY